MTLHIKEAFNAFLWLISGGIVNDLMEVIRFFRSGGADVVFFYKNGIDEQWLGSTAELALKELKAVVVIDPRQKSKTQSRSTKVFFVSSFSVFLLSAKMLVSTARIYGFNRPRKIKHQVYMPHSLVSLHAVYDPQTFDGFDVLFCCGPHHIREAEMLNESIPHKSRLLYEIGYGKMDFFRSLANVSSPSSKFQIVIAPSWARGNIIETIGLDLVRGLLDYGFSVALRPHPMEINSPHVCAIADTFRDHPDFYLEIDSHDSLLMADLMISDFSGVAFEFAFLRERPVLFLDVPQKISEFAPTSKLPAVEINARSEIGAVLPVGDMELILNRASQMIAQKEKFAAHIIAAREKYLFNLLDCADPAVKTIKNLLLA